MRQTLIFIFLLLLAPHDLSHASNDYSENLHKKRMSLCKIDHIKINHYYMNIKRKSIEEYEKYCRGVKLESDNVEYVKCLRKEPSYSKERKKNLSQIIKNLYASRITDVIGVNTTDKPSIDGFLGELLIEVDYSSGIRSDGSIYYVVNHAATLKEQAVSRSGREGFMDLVQWFEISSGDGIENADMAALNLVTKVVDKMEKTFQEAREYCSKHNLFQR